MAVYFVAYNLAKSDQNKNLWDALTAMGAKRVQDSVWAVRSSFTAPQLQKQLCGLCRVARTTAGRRQPNLGFVEPAVRYYLGVIDAKCKLWPRAAKDSGSRSPGWGIAENPVSARNPLRNRRAVTA